MRNLELYQIIEDGPGKVEYHVYGHRDFSVAELKLIITKKSLWEPSDAMPIRNKKHRVVNIIAADGWQDAK
jgi:hypothetical protein